MHRNCGLAASVRGNQVQTCRLCTVHPRGCHSHRLQRESDPRVKQGGCLGEDAREVQKSYLSSNFKDKHELSRGGLAVQA